MPRRTRADCSASSTALVELRARKQDEELLAADPITEIERAQLLAQLIRDVLEHRIAGRVSVRVIDALEVVDVADDQRDRLRR